MSDTSPLPLDPTDPRRRPVPPPPSAARDARHLGASADLPRSAPPPPRHRRPPLVPTHDPFAAYGVRDEPTEAYRPADLDDPAEVVRRPRRAIHRPTSDDGYRLSYAGTTGLVVVLGLGVVALLLVVLWVAG